MLGQNVTTMGLGGLGSFFSEISPFPNYFVVLFLFFIIFLPVALMFRWNTSLISLFTFVIATSIVTMLLLSTPTTTVDDVSVNIEPAVHTPTIDYNNYTTLNYTTPNENTSLLSIGFLEDDLEV